MSENGSDRALGERIRYVRKDLLDLTQEQFAKEMGVSRGAVGNWELGQGIKTDNLIKIAERGVPFDWLAKNEGQRPLVVTYGGKNRVEGVSSFGRRRGDPIRTVTTGGPSLDRKPEDMLPVFAAAQGGSGHLIITTEAIDFRAPPSDILRARDAHGILVVGESMIPRYEPGQIVWVTPRKHPKKDDDVVLYHEEPTGEAEAMIKRLLNFNQIEWRLRQYNPPLDFTESRADWPICHVIHSSTNA